MKTPESPLDLDSLLEPSPESPGVAVSVPPVPPVPPPPPVMVTPSLQEPLLESRWEGDEILDIPRASSADPHHDPLAVEDLLAVPSATTDFYTSSVGELTEPLFSEPAPVLETAATADAIWGTSPDEIISSSAPPLVEPPPVTPTAEALPREEYVEAGSPEPAAPSVFAQDSYLRSPGSTFVVATPDSGNKGWLAKVFLAGALVFALLCVAYFALSGPIKDWLGARKGQEVATQNPAGQAGTTTGKPGTTPSVAPSLGTKAGTDGKTAAASPSASTAASASAKPTASATATPSPAATQNANKATPTPPPASSGTSGHAVGSGDGSLAIQVAAYRTPAEAQQSVTRLKSAGVDARVIKADVPGKGIYYRVQAGRFTNEAEASKFAGELRAKGAIRDFIVAGYQAQ